MFFLDSRSYQAYQRGRKMRVNFVKYFIGIPGHTRVWNILFSKNVSFARRSWKSFTFLNVYRCAIYIRTSYGQPKWHCWKPRPNNKLPQVFSREKKKTFLSSEFLHFLCFLSAFKFMSKTQVPCTKFKLTTFSWLFW